MKLFEPDLLLRNVRHITPELLSARGIRSLILDIDNTLTLPDVQELPEGVSDWLDSMKTSGIGLMIVSNNRCERVQPFADRLGLPFVYRGAKPLPFGLNLARKKLNTTRRETALVGDQIFTDVMGARLAGIHMWMVLPFVQEKSRFFRFKRRLEKPLLKPFMKRNPEVL